MNYQDPRLSDEENFTEVYHPGRRDSDKEIKKSLWRQTLPFALSSLLIGVVGVFVLFNVLRNQQDAENRASVAAQLAEEAKQRSDSEAGLLIKAQIDACTRSNVIRRELNARIRAHSIDRAVLLQALTLAGRSGPLARSFRKLREIERRFVRFRKIPIRDCRESTLKRVTERLSK